LPPTVEIKDFPDPMRPDHPHFRLLAAIARDLDRDSKEPGDPGPMAWLTEEKIDYESVRYLIQSRATAFMELMAADKDSIVLDDKDIITMVMSGMMDGFAIGYLFGLSKTDELP
jgi:hypothetical protein